MSDFFNMGGYALYVWVSYGLALVILVWNVILPMQRRKKHISMIKRRLRRAQNEK
ncbi:Cytochrome c-type biogenesis protein CcmD, interacts with CcmCE [hydrothermal vent metagenome]|uniref:Cytochrome c-type biogenesis protein CcmD n=1 Tax=hydrothermal vent metagenome TaxID=652676 RepID=A0A3B1BRI4_9ZZZZ